MKIIHKLFHTWDAEKVRVLRQYGIDVEPGLSNVFLEENELYWKLKPTIEAWDVWDAVGTEFSKQDLDDASFFQTFPKSQTQYPQPEEEFGYIYVTYDTTNYCEQCGTGLVQNDSFRLKHEPKWGKRNAFMLHWILDEIFVRREVYEQIFVPIGIDSKPVLLHGSGSIIKSTVQLVIPNSSELLALEGYNFELCTTCGRKKYLPITRGFCPPFCKAPADHLFKSREYFGSGFQASNWIFVSKDLRNALLKGKVKMSYVPLRS